MKRAQSATEFVLLVSFMLMVFFLFFLIIQQRVVDVSRAQDVLYLQEATNVVKTEVQLANAMGTDFTRSFTLDDLGGQRYDIDLVDNFELVATYNDLQYVVFLPINVTGPLNQVGVENTLYHLDGIALFPDGSFSTYDDADGLFLNVNPETCYIADTLARCGDTDFLPANQQPLCNSLFGLC